jgi:hypothetical protein
VVRGGEAGQDEQNPLDGEWGGGERTEEEALPEGEGDGDGGGGGGWG